MKRQTHYQNTGARLSAQLSKLAYRFWVGDKAYQASDKDAADWKLSQGLRVEKLNPLTDQWEDYNG